MSKVDKWCQAGVFGVEMVTGEEGWDFAGGGIVILVQTTNRHRGVCALVIGLAGWGKWSKQQTTNIITKTLTCCKQMGFEKLKYDNSFLQWPMYERGTLLHTAQDCTVAVLQSVELTTYWRSGLIGLRSGLRLL